MAAGGTEPCASLGSEPFSILAARLLSQLPTLCVEVLARLAPDPQTDSSDLLSVHPELRGAVQSTLDVQLRAFAAEADPGPHTREALSLIRSAGGLERALALYRATHMVLWESWFDLIEAADPDPAVRRRLLSQGAEFFFACTAQLGESAVAWHAERQPPSQRRRDRLILELLDGQDVGAEAALEFDFERNHLGLISWGEDPNGVLGALASLLERPLLVVKSPEPAAGAWAWISGSRPLEAEAEARIAALELPAGARISVGRPGYGVAGFCATHRQALRARQFAPARSPSLTRYDDVIVEALATESEEDARAFVAHELRGIDDDSPGSCRLRETLEAYFASGYNAASAAASLGIHQQTVANRLRSAEQRLGTSSIGVRRVELEMALRLRHSFEGGRP